MNTNNIIGNFGDLFSGLTTGVTGTTGPVGPVGICGTTGPNGFTGYPMTHTVTGAPYFIWVPKCDLDQLDDKLSPFPEVKPTPEPLTMIDF